MVNFAIELTPPRPGSRRMDLSPGSFVKSDKSFEALTKRSKSAINLNLSRGDLENATVHPRPRSQEVMATYVEEMRSSKLLVLIPAEGKLEHAAQKLYQSQCSEKTLAERLEALESIVAQQQTFSAQQQTLLEQQQSRLDEDDRIKLKAYGGNLVIKLMEHLQEEHDVKVAGQGNDTKACKKRLVRVAESLWDQYGKAKKGEQQDQLTAKWSKNMRLDVKYMNVVRDFETLVARRNAFAHETSEEFAKLLMREQFYQKNAYYYWGGLLEYVEGKSVEELADMAMEISVGL